MNKKIFYLLILIPVLIIAIIIIKNASSTNINSREFIVKQAKVEEQTIIRKLTNPMEITSGLTEKVELRASYYFKEMCVEENTYIKEGENILKYTNGTYLTAPYDCVVTSSELPKEDEICTNSNYVELKTIETLSTTISVSEWDMNYISLGKKVEILINALAETKYEGYVTNISEVATNSKFDITITFINDGNIKLGMSGSSTIVLQEEKDVVVVPIETVEVEENNKYVQIVHEDGTTEDVAVETGLSDAKYVQIKSGLEIGQTVNYKDIATGNNTIVTNSNSTSNGMMQGEGQRMRLF